MTSIKVIYQSTVRRFSVPNTITWLDLESKLRELFSLPSTFKFSLSYTDEEGDVITLSTDLELQEFLSSQSTLKFTLTPEKHQPFVVDTFSGNTSENDFVSVEKEKLIPDNVSEKLDKHVTVMDAADEPSFKPTIPSISKGKQKEESSAESSNKQQQEEQPSPNNNNEQRAPFIDLAEQFQGLLDQFKDVFSKNPQLIEQANNVMDQILRNVPVDIDQWAQWLNTFRSDDNTSTTNAQGDETNNSREQQQQFPSFFPPPNVLLSNPWIQQMVQDVCAGNFENFARPTGFNRPWNFNGGCPYQQQQQQQQREELSQEALKEKINLLHSMGFWEDDVKNEELLNRYKGDIERVVEILIRQQTERINNDPRNSMEGVVESQ
ncbi:hypothetical protein C1645_788003 [Glomus cerebriforme]|uniref:PB1 domain-containing protein n=1 Tax=Glomus cerebriforme TaxID=658196 RepID=A0A397SCR3_9GLOM|nr:hypothetical protein C1645_788003 [Glomus cerebriforme]